MASPLIGIAAVNSLLFAAYSQSKKIVSPYPVLTLPQTAVAGGMAGAINSVLASPVELFKIRMQGGLERSFHLKRSALGCDMATNSRMAPYHLTLGGWWQDLGRQIRVLHTMSP